MSTVTLNIRGDAGYDIGSLAELLSTIDPTANVTADSIVVDSAKVDDVKAILAEVGIEILENQVSASVSLATGVTQEELLKSAALKLNAGFSTHLTASSGKATWNLIDSEGTPIAAIHLADQDDAESLAKIFASDTYGNTLTSAFEKLGATELLVRTKARLYSEKEVKAPEAINIEAHVNDQQIRANFCFDLALKAAQKNVIQDPLKQTVLAALTAQGIDNPLEVVSSMFDSFPQFLTVIRAQAEKYMSMDSSALQATEDMLNSMEERELKLQNADPINGNPLSASALNQRARMRSVPEVSSAMQQVTASVAPSEPALDLRASVASAFSHKF